jgi:hypothetical protein
MTLPRPLPIYTLEEAIDYAEGCAQRWQQAMHAGDAMTLTAWQAVEPPDLLRVPGMFWPTVRQVFAQRCGLDAHEAAHRWLVRLLRWAQREQPWIERVEAELRDYDQRLGEGEYL